MSDRLSATDDGYQDEAAEGYFARLASTRCMLLTTIKLDGTFMSAPVQGVVDGDRAYFRAWSWSGTVKRLEHTDVVQVTPCSVLGLCSYPPPLDVAVRSLTAEEARRVAGKLARKYPVQHRFLIRLLHRTCRWQMAYYELLALDAADDQDVCLAPSGVPDVQRDQSGGYGTRRPPSGKGALDVTAAPPQPVRPGKSALMGMVETTTLPVTLAHKLARDTGLRAEGRMTGLDESAIRQFESWTDYHSAVDTEFRYDPQRETIGYDAAGVGIDNNLWPGSAELRILFLPHGFSMDGSHGRELGNLVACSMAEKPPAWLLARRVPFALATRLITERPATVRRVIEVLRNAPGGDPAE